VESEPTRPRGGGARASEKREREKRAREKRAREKRARERETARERVGEAFGFYAFYGVAS
tara:strand:- start:1330 stop:1509 length:180 start_codon:yes stop_codon:yes gene_type:complete